MTMAAGVVHAATARRSEQPAAAVALPTPVAHPSQTLKARPTSAKSLLKALIDRIEEL